MKKMKQIWIAAICWCVMVSSYAAVDLELTRGVKAPIPIAIINFANQNSVPDAVPPATQVDEVIRQDLQNSGRFQIADNQSFTQTPADSAAIDFNYWRQFRLNAMVVGQVKNLGQDQYQVTFTLINLFKAQTTGADNHQSDLPDTQNTNQAADAANTDPVLITQTFTVSHKQLRHIAHVISNQIYQKLVGEPGIFTSKIAYIMTQPQSDPKAQLTQYTLQVADYDGYQAKTLLTSVDPIMSPTWSPDGMMLAFVSFDNKGYPAIYTIPVNGGSHRLLSAVTGLNAAPAWSPNGQQIALVLSKSGNPKINILNLANKTTTPITFGWSADTEPVWMPDGQNIVFTSNRDGSPQIYKINLASQTITQLTTVGGYNANPMITPNSKTLALIHGEGRNYNVAVQDLDDNQGIHLLTSNGLVSSLTVAPDSNLIMYSAYNKDHETLAVTSVDGSVNFSLPTKPNVNFKEPAWGPYQP